MTWSDIDLGGGPGLATVSDSKTALKLGRESAMIRVWFTPKIEDDQMTVNQHHVVLYSFYHNFLFHVFCVKFLKVKTNSVYYGSPKETWALFLIGQDLSKFLF